MNPHTTSKETQMQSMVEALVRERMHESVRTAHRARLVNELTAARRWHRRQERARVAHERHSRRVEVLSAAVAG